MTESFPITMHYGNPSPDETAELIQLLAGAWMGVAPRGASIMPPGLSRAEQHRILKAVFAAEFRSNWKSEALRWCTDQDGRIAAFACLDPLHGGNMAAGAGEVPITPEELEAFLPGVPASYRQRLIVIVKQLIISDERAWSGITHAALAGDGRIFEIRGVGVHPDQKGRGIGARFMKELLAEATGALVTITTQNMAAARFYQRLGFEVILEEEWTLPYPEGTETLPHWVMSTLAPGVNSGPCDRV